jgi:hypothetical protein
MTRNAFASGRPETISGLKRAGALDKEKNTA